VDGQIDEVEKELEERETPVRLRDKRAASDDGYEDYLTMAEATARMVRVAASMEKLKLLKGYKRRLKKEKR
jgi:hypothetical protein